jgi:hypothetical protein
VCDQENYANENKRTDGLQAGLLGFALVPSILFLRIGIIELETKHPDMKILLSVRGCRLIVHVSGGAALRTAQVSDALATYL